MMTTTVDRVAQTKKQRKTVKDYFKKRQTRNKSDEQQLRILLQKLISPLSYGIDKTPGEKSPVAAVKKFDVEQFLGGNQGYRPTSINDTKFAKHRSGEQLLYFYGRDGYCKESDLRKRFLSLLMIDIDCHKEGTIAGAMELARELREYFPSMYIERSGGGAHAYLIVDVGENTKGASLNECYRDFEISLNRFGAQFDVEKVEIKGTPHEIRWIERVAPGTGTEGDELEEPCHPEVKFGSLATIPKFISLGQLLDAPVFELHEIYEVSDKLTSISPELREAKERQQHTSCSLQIEVDETLERVADCAWKLSDIDESFQVGRRKVTREDLAIFLSILHFCFTHENKDGSLPTRRIKAIWKSLFENGQVARGHSDQKVKLLRGLLSKLGWIEWQDNTFCNSKACKWRLAEEVYELIEDERLSLITSQKTNNNIFAYTEVLTSDLRQENPFEKPVFNVPDELLSPYEVERRRIIEMEEEVKLLFAGLAA